MALAVSILTLQHIMVLGWLKKKLLIFDISIMLANKQLGTLEYV